MCDGIIAIYLCVSTCGFNTWHVMCFHLLSIAQENSFITLIEWILGVNCNDAQHKIILIELLSYLCKLDNTINYYFIVHICVTYGVCNDDHVNDIKTWFV